MKPAANHKLAPRWAALALLCGAACAPTWEDAANQDTIDAYRRFIAFNPESEHGVEAAKRVETLTFRRAQRTGTIRAYREYLAEFPTGVFKAEAQENLERLRFEKAKAAATREAYENYLFDHPRGRYVKEAREFVAQQDYQGVRKSSDPGLLAAFLRDYPELPEAGDIRVRLDDLDFATAKRHDTEAAYHAYLEKHPAGRHRAPARDRLIAFRVAALRDAVDPDSLELFIAGNPGLAEAGELLDRAAWLRFEQVAATLDPLATTDAAAALPGAALRERGAAVAKAVAAAHKTLQKRPGLPQAIALLVPKITATEIERELARLKDSDPRERWLAAAKLGKLKAGRAFEALLGLTEDPYIAVRIEAAEAIKGVAPVLEPAQRQALLHDAVRKLEGATQTTNAVRLGLLLELLERWDAAAEAYHRQVLAHPDDVFARMRLVFAYARLGKAADAKGETARLGLLLRNEMDARRKVISGGASGTGGAGQGLALRQMFGIMRAWESLCPLYPKVLIERFPGAAAMGKDAPPLMELDCLRERDTFRAWIATGEEDEARANPDFMPAGAPDRALAGRPGTVEKLAAIRLVAGAGLAGAALCLAYVLRYDTDASARLEAARSLLALGPDSLPEVRAAVRREPETEVRARLEGLLHETGKVR